LSGIVGIFERNGKQADRALLRALTHFLSFCGPDAREVWSQGPIGLGHTLLRTTREQMMDRQPVSLNGNLWITADARIDCRIELETELKNADHKIQGRVTDAELILNAYAAWGEECVQHLRGDFAFAIWDARSKTLFCARDHFGIKPFYYAVIGSQFILSNILNCLRQLPEVSTELNDAAIADFLLFGLNCDVATTSFRDVCRLPPAHTLSVNSEGMKVARYWSAPTDGRIRYRHAHEYVEHFQILFQAAIADRLRTDRGGVLLSGGLDSGSVAAMAREISSRSPGGLDLRAYTVTYDSSSAENDSVYARKSAEFLGIPLRCMPMDHLEPFERWDNPGIGPPEPMEDPFFAGLHEQFCAISADTRVALSGEGADNLMHFENLPYMRDLLRNREWKRIFADGAGYLRARPSVWKAAQRRILGFVRRESQPSVIPDWIAPDLVKRLGLQARWREWSKLPGPPLHPILPRGHASLSLPQWSHMFEIASPGVTRCPVEVRYPFLDLRIVEYLLALPPYPWFFEKALLREAMIGRLPEDVRVRPKKAFSHDPLMAKLLHPAARSMDSAAWESEMESFVRRSELRGSAAGTNSGSLGSNFRPACLNFWLQTSRRVRYNMQAEARNA
jgi:asparagine synthase (glutamine-hydrolysing)